MIRGFLAVLLFLCSASAALAQQSIIPLIIQYESGGNPTITSNVPGSTASGLFQDITSTWQQALADCGSACGSISQYPTAASAPASVQIAANSALINANGLSDWTCPGCDPALVAAINAAGGIGAFQTSGLDTNPADFTGADGNLSGFLAGLGGTGGTPLSTNGLGGASVGSGGSTLTAGGGGLGGQTIVTNLPGTGSGPGSGVLDQIVQTFQGATTGWQAALMNAASDLFWFFAFFDLFISLYFLFTSQGGGNAYDVLVTLIRWAMPIGLFWWVLQNGSTFGGYIVQGLQQLGLQIGGAGNTPSTVFWAGVDIVSTIWNNMHGFLGSIEEIPVMLAALPIIVMFALAAVWMMMALIEAYFVIGLAALFLAFGGMRWTRNIAITLLMACIAVGFKLLAIEVICGVGVGLVTQWAQNAAGLSFQGIFVMFGASVAFAALVKLVPDRLERIIQGYTSSMAHYSQPLREAGAATAMVAAPVAGMAGFGMLAWQLIKHAAESEARGMNEIQGTSRLGLITSAAANAAGAELGGRLGGIYRGGIAASTARMAGNVSQQRAVAAAEAGRPQPPSGGSP